MTDKEKGIFNFEESSYYQMCQLKEDLLHKQLIREQELYRHVAKSLPVRIGDFIYYRRIENPADQLTLYRFPVDELQPRELGEGDLPQLQMAHDEVEDVQKSEDLKDFPE